MENLTLEQVEELTDLLDADDYRKPGEDSEAFARRLDALITEFLTTIDEHIGRIKLALAQRESRTELM